MDVQRERKAADESRLVCSAAAHTTGIARLCSKLLFLCSPFPAEEIKNTISITQRVVEKLRHLSSFKTNKLSNA